MTSLNLITYFPGGPDSEYGHIGGLGFNISVGRGDTPFSPQQEGSWPPRWEVPASHWA